VTLTCHGLNLNQGRFICFTFTLFHLENHVCLSRSVQAESVAWRATTRIVTGVGDLVYRTGDGRTDRILGGRTIARSGDVVCGMHRAHGDEERVFLD
jgi:hypothetical protein